jgi:hypothetical protein
MESVMADRRLVKSPPELWAEVSDPESLARHLGELGEIRITRTQPETTVAWEAEQAAGTIEIEPSGWGTRVCLSAAPAAPPEPEPPPPAAAPSKVETELRVVDQDRRRIELPAIPPAPPGVLARLLGRRPEPAPNREPRTVELRIVHAACACRVPERPLPPPPPDTEGSLAPDALREVLDRVLDDLGAAHHRPFSRG